MLWFFGKEIQIRYRTSTGESTRSMCDDACCDFLARRYKSRYRTSTGESNRSMCDDACCDFLAKRYKVDIAHLLANRIGRCAMMHVVIFLANRYKSRYRTSTGIESVDVPWCTLCSMWETTFPRNSQDWLGRDFTESKWFKRNWWYLAQIQVLTYDDALR